MITHVYICNRCSGDLESRTFEIEYKDFQSAERARHPACPLCGSSEYVSRFFGHNIFAAPKSNRAGLPGRFVPMEDRHRKAVVSLGVRMDEHERTDFEDMLRKIVESVPVESTDAPDRDLTEEKLGLKKGTIDRALFDIRQQQLIEELESGKKIAGFYLPLTGQSNN
jgi:hypothetical protein